MKAIMVIFTQRDGAPAYVVEEQERPETPGMTSYIHTGIADRVGGGILALRQGAGLYWIVPLTLLADRAVADAILYTVRMSQEQHGGAIEAEVALPKLHVDIRENTAVVARIHRILVEAGLDAPVSVAQRTPSGDTLVEKCNDPALTALAFPKVDLSVRN